MDHHAVPVQGLEYLEATAFQVMMANKPMKTLACYLSPSRRIIASDLSACFGGGIPVLMEGYLNAKNVEWKSRLSTERGRILRDYADRISCLIYGPNTPTTVPYIPTATPRVLDIGITKDLGSPIYLTTCSALSSDHPFCLIRRVDHPFSAQQTTRI
jgi:hypothetical protein